MTVRCDAVRTRSSAVLRSKVQCSVKQNQDTMQCRVTSSGSMMQYVSKTRCDLVGTAKQCAVMWLEVAMTPSNDRWDPRVDANGEL
jgi:hypothetical protein